MDNSYIASTSLQFKATQLATWSCIIYAYNVHIQVEINLSEVTNNSEEAIKQVQYLLMKHGVSTEFYHELSMIFPELPRSYKVAN